MEGGSPATGSPSRRRLLLGAALVGALLAVLVVGQRRPLVEKLVASRLRALGLEQVSLVAERVGLRGLELRELRATGAGDLRVERIEARYTPLGLLTGSIEEIRIAGLRLAASPEDLLGSSPEETRRSRGGDALPELPAQQVLLEDARVEIATAEGPLAVEMRGEIRAGERPRARAEVALRHPVLSGSLQLRAEDASGERIGQLDVELAAEGELASGLGVRGGALSLAATLVRRDDAIELRATRCPELRARELFLRDAISLTEPLRLCADFQGRSLLSLARTQDGGLRVAGDLDFPPTTFGLRVGPERAPLRIQGKTPRLRVSAPPAGGATLRIETGGGDVHLPDYGVVLRGLEGAAELDLESWLPEGSLRVAELYDLRRPARFAPLSAQARSQRRGESLAVSLVASDEPRHLVLELSGSHEPARGQGRARLRLAPLVFEPDGLQPAQLFPTLRGQVDSAKGSLEALGSLTWGESGTASSLDIALRNLGAKGDDFSFEGVDGVVHLQGSPWPLEAPPGQLLSVPLLDFGLPLTGGVIEFGITPEQEIEVASSEWLFAGGQVRAAGRIDLAAEERSLELAVMEVDLAELLDLVTLEGLSGEGRIQGDLPLALREGDLEIRAGSLAGTPAGGWIHYQPDERMRALAAQNPQLQQLFQALGDFQYESLRLDVDGQATGDVAIGLHLRGFNPDYEEGRTVEFNLALETPLSVILRPIGAVRRVVEGVEQLFEDFSRRRPPADTLPEQPTPGGES